MRFLLRIAFTAIATWLVAWMLPGIHLRPFGEEWWQVALTALGVAAVFGIVNATLGNLIRIVAFPIYLLTIGIVSFFVNGLLLMIVHWISEGVGYGIQVDNYWWGILGALLIAIFTGIITLLTRPIFGKQKPRKR